MRHCVSACFSLALAALAFASRAMTAQPDPDADGAPILVSAHGQSVERGKFAPTWKSLQQYQVPRWYQDAKFGIWAHWGPQCEPESGDWYARQMYFQGDWQYNAHLKKYGHPSKFGFKDVIHEWKAENWDPARLMALYKRAGAQYFVALANHHDNFDLWNSKYQPWNSVNMGPRKDLIGGWAKAARANGLRFGVSVHAAHAWTWMESSQGADRTGPLAGVPYDGRLTEADGRGQWWEGYDPQDLYAQNHAPSVHFDNSGAIHSQWNWGNGASIPDAAYCNKFYNRTIDLINAYQPDLLYFDDTVLPLYPISDAGLQIAAHFYNSNRKRHGGKLEAVLNGKILGEEQRKAMVWDIERGQSNQIEPYVWQTDTCIGSWHYDRGIYERNGYKSAGTVIQTLADVVSKNGNLLLSIPVRGDGTIDEKETAIVEGIADWMKFNRESIFGTRPWKVFGEGPASEGAALSAQGFNEGRGKPFTSQDFRFTTKGNTLYAIAMGWPQSGTLTIRTLATTQNIKGAVRDVQLLGGPKVAWRRNGEGLIVTLPPQKSGENAWVLKIQGLDLAASRPVLVASQAAVVHPNNKGTFALSAELARLHGGLRTEERGGATNIGFWDNAGDWASWTLDVPQPGACQVTARLATIHDGAEFVVEVAGQKIEGQAPNTGAWENYQNLALGRIEFKQAGKFVLTLRPRDAAHWKAINLASIQLDKSHSHASAAEGGFLFTTFRDEATPMSEQIYMGISRDGRHWDALNGGAPVLVSDVGEKGVRDSFLLRSHDGRKVWLIATDLCIARNGDWQRATRRGSRSIVVWESSDLVHWTKPRLAVVAPSDAGCVWAPEAIYDEDAGDYLVYWASTTARDNFSRQRIWAARTKDFRSFSTPFMYVEKSNHVIDIDIVRDGDSYYRFAKDDREKSVSMEASKRLLGPWRPMPQFTAGQGKNFEGPICYRLQAAARDQPPVWCLLLDNVSDRIGSGAFGYMPFLSNDLSTGQFTHATGFRFPYPFRHGSVLPITAAERERLKSAHADPQKTSR